MLRTSRSWLSFIFVVVLMGVLLPLVPGDVSYADQLDTWSGWTYGISDEFERIIYNGNTSVALGVDETILQSASADCAATLSSDLKLNIPVVSFAGYFYQVGFQYSPSSDGLIWFTLADIAQTTQGGCGNPATLSLVSDKYIFHIPSLDLSGTSFWLDLEYVPTADGLLWVKLTNYGITVNVPLDLTATAVSTTQINLSWTDNSNNEELFAIERKTGSEGSYSQIATVGADVTTYSDTGLTATTTYYYRVRTYNSALGFSGYSNEASTTTQGGGTTITDGDFKSGSFPYEILFTIENNMITSLYVLGCSTGLGFFDVQIPITNGAFDYSSDGALPSGSFSVHVSGTFTDNNHANGIYSGTFPGDCIKGARWSATRQ